MEALRQQPLSDSIDRKLTDHEIGQRIKRIDALLPELRRRLSPCTLCPRHCGAKRTEHETGECGLDDNLRIASVANHKGEEPPISGNTGAINVFFSGCNLHCIHCQNWPISQMRVGKVFTVEQLAKKIMSKSARGAHSLGWVTPTPQIVPALEAYRICLASGLNLPLVFNCGGYEDIGVIRLLTGIIDIWLPDAKTSDESRAASIQSVKDYPERNTEAISAMVEQVDAGNARAVIVRHLPLPDGLNDSMETLKRLWSRFGNAIHISLMMQYFPTYQTEGDAVLGRRLKEEEYTMIVDLTSNLGFEKGWVQDYDTETGISPHGLL